MAKVSHRHRIISWDSETHRIKAGQLCPRPVVVSWAERRGGTTATAGLLIRPDALAWARRNFPDPDILWIGENLAYDFAVLCAEDASLLEHVFRMYMDGRVCSLELRQKLIDIAHGERKFRRCRGRLEKAKYGLADLVHHHLDEKLDKEDTWRMHYGDFDPDGVVVPLVDWPDDAKDYSLLDAIKPLEVYDKQEIILSSPTSIWAKKGVPPIHDEVQQNRAALAMHLGSVRGLRTDPEAVKALLVELDARHNQATPILMAAGIWRWDAKKQRHSQNTKVTRAKVETWFKTHGQPAPMTPPSKTFPNGQISLKGETLILTDDPDLLELEDVGESEKVRSNWVKHLVAGTKAPLCPRGDVILETGRTSYSKPPIQTPPRATGVRPCVWARPGYVFISSDYDTLELRTLAQTLLELCGKSAMADALIAGKDLHLLLAAEILGFTEAQASALLKAGDKQVEDMRQCCKPANFGFPGGMKPPSFVGFAKGYSPDAARLVDLKMAEKLYHNWLRKWPEMDRYFTIIKGMMGYGQTATIVQPGSLRLRGDTPYCAACNTKFQGRAADGAKEAMWRICCESYLGVRTDGVSGLSPLYGCRMVIFMHDEFILECPEGQEHPAAARLGEVMREAMGVYVKDIPIKCTPVATRRWYKGAKPVLVNSTLVPSKPVKVMGTNGKESTTWVADLAA